MLTRAEIEHIKKNSREIAVSAYDLMQGYTMEFASSPEDHRNEYSRYEDTFIALCDMALAWLEVQPRALKDIEGGHALYFELANEDQSTWSQRLWKNRKGEWVAHPLGEPWDIETLAIPFSALPSTTPEKVT